MAQLDLSVLRLMRVALVIAVAALTGCALKVPPAHDEIVGQALPSTTRIPPEWKAAPAASPVADNWLQSLDDPTLDALVREAIANNLDLRIAAANVAIAQQAVIVVGAQLSPQVGATLGTRATWDDDHDDTADSTMAYAGVAWELDVWGRLRAQRAAAEAGYEATALDYAYARQSIAAMTAKLWYLTIESRRLVALAEEAVTIFRQLQALVQIRRSAGKDSDLDVFDVRAKFETAQSEVEQARQRFGEARRALEVLLGRYPAAEIDVAAEYPALPALAGTGVPSTLLERRPDIAAAERGVVAAFRSEEAAELALLPAFSFSLVGGRLGDQVLSVLRLNPWLASAGIGVSIPIYEGGALRAKVVIATALQSKAVARYGSVALTAFREVETSLANERLYALQLPLDQRALDDRREAVRIATVQYKAGRRDLLWVAQLQTAALSTESDLIKVQSAQRVNRVRLHQVLGDSFDAAPAGTL
jgi:multidrug efflux system outer membrane protein